MRTFFAFFHIGRVLWVTDQVPFSHSKGGGLKTSKSAGLASLMGARRLREGAEVVGGVACVAAVSAMLYECI